jgi:UDP-N-acetylglucosamine:LPS N-acetylglucosamine transferase
MLETIDLVYFNAGGGHRSAALALQEAIREQGRPWNVRLVNLLEVLDPDGKFRKYTGMAPEDYYNKRLARGWTLGLAQELKILQGMIRLGHTSLVRALQQHWLTTEPDLVVSLIPNFNRSLYESLTASLPGVPYVTVMTDLADLPPHFWIEAGQDQHIVCGTPHAVEQARAAGYPEHRISLTSGMILRPSFYRPTLVDRAAELRALGLDPQRPTGIVMFGGHGASQMTRIAAHLHDVQLILICGRNQSLARTLRDTTPSAPHAVIGFTDDMPRYMRLGDFFIGKPGPGSLSEALHIGLPVITFENTWTMPQERYNARWVRETGVGLVIKSVRPIRAAVAELVGSLAELGARVRLLRNRAVFEVPEILADVIAGRNEIGPCGKAIRPRLGQAECLGDTAGANASPSRRTSPGRPLALRPIATNVG